MEEEPDPNQQPKPAPPQPFTIPAPHQTSISPHENQKDETDSGFRSRLNSTAQSCSPGSSFSSESDGSPSRKYSKTTQHHHPHEPHASSTASTGPNEYATRYSATNPGGYTYQAGENRPSHGHGTRSSTSIQYSGGTTNNWSFGEMRRVLNEVGYLDCMDEAVGGLRLAKLEFGAMRLSGGESNHLL